MVGDGSQTAYAPRREPVAVLEKVVRRAHDNPCDTGEQNIPYPSLYQVFVVYFFRLFRCVVRLRIVHKSTLL